MCQAYGTPVNPESLFITAGASQSLDWLCALFTQPGDTIFIEEPSYLYAFRIFTDHRLKVVGIPTDENGIIIEALEEALQHERPAFVYTIPTFQNPTGATLPPGRREQLVELSRTYNFLLIADEVYHCLHFDLPPPRPLAAHSAEGNIVSLGSFSKILAPGLRLGWIQGPPPILQRLTLSGVADGGGLIRSPRRWSAPCSKKAARRGFADRLRPTLPDACPGVERRAAARAARMGHVPRAAGRLFRVGTAS